MSQSPVVRIGGRSGLIGPELRARARTLSVLDALTDVDDSPAYVPLETSLEVSAEQAPGT